jgi:Flp pilus assembly protein TadD
MHDSSIQSDPAAEQAAYHQLVELGYVDAVSDDKQANVNKSVDESKYNLARSYMSVGRHADAASLLEEVHHNQPERLMVAYELADCYQVLKRNDECRSLIDHIASGKCFNPALEDKKLKVVPQVDYLYGVLELNNGNNEKAMEHLLKAEEKVGNFIGLHKSLGNAYLNISRLDDAERAFNKALETDPDDPVALHGLAIVALEQGNNEEAVELTLRSLEILFHQPRAHYHLGLACMRMGELVRAQQAFQAADNMRPEVKDVQDMLAEVAKLAAASSRES